MRLPKVAGSAVAGPALAISLLLAWSDVARAHERDFTVSRDWHLPYKGEHEIESRTFWDPRPNDLTQQFEYEYGITDHFAVEPGIKFLKLNGEDFETLGADIELRFNFLDFGYDKILPAVNLEYEHSFGEHDDIENLNMKAEKNAVELKGILSYYTESGQDFSINLNVGREFEEHEAEWESEITGGWVRPLDFIPGFEPSQEHPMNIGFEFSQGLSHEKLTDIGPVVSWRADLHFHVLTTFLYAVNHRSHHYDELRVILEWEF